MYPIMNYRMEGNFGAAKFGKIDDWPKICQIFAIQIFTHLAIGFHMNIEQIH